MSKAGVTQSIAASLLAVVLGFGLAGAASASQGVDPCYKLCVMSGNYKTQSARQDCSRRCRASDRYQCDSKCVRRFPNAPREALACRRKCVGMPGGW